MGISPGCRRRHGLATLICSSRLGCMMLPRGRGGRCASQRGSGEAKALEDHREHEPRGLGRQRKHLRRSAAQRRKESRYGAAAPAPTSAAGSNLRWSEVESGIMMRSKGAHQHVGPSLGSACHPTWCSPQRYVERNMTGAVGNTTHRISLDDRVREQHHARQVGPRGLTAAERRLDLTTACTASSMKGGC